MFLFYSFFISTPIIHTPNIIILTGVFFILPYRYIDIYIVYIDMIYTVFSSCIYPSLPSSPSSSSSSPLPPRLSLPSAKRERKEKKERKKMDGWTDVSLDAAEIVFGMPMGHAR